VVVSSYMKKHAPVSVGDALNACEKPFQLQKTAPMWGYLGGAVPGAALMMSVSKRLKWTLKLSIPAGSDAQLCFE